MMGRNGIFAILVGSAMAAGGLGLVRRRRRMRAGKNPSGLADAELSEADRKAATEEAKRRLAEEQARRSA